MIASPRPSQTVGWRGPGAGRPDLPLPPAAMPLIRNGRPRKRWRYVGFYGEQVMLCAARAQVGPLGQCFWAIWDRESGASYEHTRLRPGGDEVVLAGPRVEINHGSVRVRLRLEPTPPVEVICPSGERGWGWTEKRAGVPITGTITIDGREREVTGHGVDDVSAGYHQRHTAWRWSAGVGISESGEPLGWNLVEGINDPEHGSERAIWTGEPPAARISEPGPVSFEELDAIRFEHGERLRFEPGSERSRSDNFGLVSSSYRHRFGTFTGSLAGVRLAQGRGVMEEHEARW